MPSGWLPRLIALLGFLALVYSLDRPWVSIRFLAVKLDYKPWRLFEQMAQGRWDLLNELLRIAEEIPNGVQFVSLFALHLSLLIIALILGFLSIIGNSFGGYLATAAFSALSSLLLLHAVERAQLLSYAAGSGSLLSIGSALVYVASAVVLKSLK